MSSHGKQLVSDLNLSLEGSGIQSAASTNRVRPNSAKQLKRPNSMTDISKGNKSQSLKKKTATKYGELTSHRSGFSDISSVSCSRHAEAAKKDNLSSDEFLALFENSAQPKIRDGTKYKKPASNAVKVLSDKSANEVLKMRLNTKALNSRMLEPVTATVEDNDEWLTTESNTHSIFQKTSARSSSDDDVNDITDRLSASLNYSSKPLHSATREKSEHTDMSEVAGSQSRNGGINGNGKYVTSVANNLTSQGMSKCVKLGLSALENSYQNIKHKTPVNQTKKSQSGTVSSGLGANTLVEDHIKTLNFAATKIQRWYLRHHKRRKAGQAAIQRLLHAKKEMYEEQMLRESKNDFTVKDLEERRQEERKKNREEKAKAARKGAIKELQKKREEKREEMKKKAEQEIAFLQADGTISKSIKTGLGKKKGSKVHSRKAGDVDANINTNDDGSPEKDLMENNSEMTVHDDNTDNYYHTHQQEVDSTQGEVRDNEGTSHVTASESVAKTTLDDLFDTLKKLEEEEQLASARPQRKNAWLDELEKQLDTNSKDSLSADNLQKLNSQKVELSTRSSLLSDDKMKSIIAFLDEVQVSERLSTVDQEISKLTADLERPGLTVLTSEDLDELEQANACASEVTNTVISQRLELDEKKRTVSMLQKALNQQRELTVRHAKETDKEMKEHLEIQKNKYEKTIEGHLLFINQLIDEKENLSKNCEKLVNDLKQNDKKYKDQLKSITDKHYIEMQKLKDMNEAAEKLRRERWIEEKTKKIKEMTVKGLEPEIQRLIAKHKSELKKIQQIHEAELLESDERAAQKYVKMTEELRDQLAQEKEAACARERELAKQRFEKQIQNEEEAYQQQRRRLLTEIQEEKERLAQMASRQRAEIDKLQQQLHEKHAYALEAMKTEFDKAREEQENRHATEIREFKERMEIEKQTWEENYRKKQENFLMQQERQLKENVKKDRNKEIELVIHQLEEDATAAREECERVAENRIKRIREKYESEMKEVECSEKQAMEKYNEMKARLTEVEGENEILKVQFRQKEQEIKELQKLTDKMHTERNRVSDIIRQEFADRLVFTEEENKRIKTEISELKARQRIELDHAKEEIEEIKRQKDEEMDEVHKRVKQAIVKKEEVVTQLKEQYQAALKRADHIEGLLQQQRKQLLGK